MERGALEMSVQGNNELNSSSSLVTVAHSMLDGMPEQTVSPQKCWEVLQNGFPESLSRGFTESQRQQLRVQMMNYFQPKRLCYTFRLASELGPDNYNIILTRLFVPSTEIGCLCRDGLLSEIKRLSGAKVQILPKEDHPPCISEADELVQVRYEKLAKHSCK